MAKVVSYSFGETVGEVIARDQTLLAGDFFNLNGTGAANGTFEYDGIIRTVSIFATLSDQSGNVFKVSGYLYGQEVSEEINGPDATLGIKFSETAQLFSVVTSVEAINGTDGDDVSVGIGTIGCTDWFISNTYATNQSISVQVWQGGTLADAHYTFQTTLANVFSEEFTYGADNDTIEAKCSLGILMPSTTGGGKAFDRTMLLDVNTLAAPTKISTFTYPTLYSRVKMTNGLVVDDNTGEFQVKMLQQG
jgi:hypothetical protein